MAVAQWGTTGDTRHFVQCMKPYVLGLSTENASHFITICGDLEQLANEFWHFRSVQTLIDVKQ